jgi:hypothetical protein
LRLDEQIGVHNICISHSLFFQEKDAPFRTMIEVIAQNLTSTAEHTKQVVNNSASSTKKPTSADSSHGSSDDRSHGTSSPPPPVSRSPKKPVSAGLKKNMGRSTGLR